MLHNFKEEMENQRLNREVIGEDRFGNKYFQYYSYYGLPTRRQIFFKNPHSFDIQDLVYYDWLHHRVYDPPTEQQKKQFYLQQENRFKRALEWDQKESLKMVQFRRKREQLLLRDRAIKELEEEMSKQLQIEDIKTKRIQGMEDEKKLETN